MELTPAVINELKSLLVERIVDELETKLYNAQEQDLLRSVTNMGGLH